MAETDRETLFSNEGFIIGMLQAVSGGALVVGIAQVRSLIRLSGPFCFRAFLTVMAMTLVASVLAGYWKHEYKLWDMKAGVSSGHGLPEVAAARQKKASWYLVAMRRAISFSVFALVIGLVALIFSLWM